MLCAYTTIEKRNPAITELIAIWDKEALPQEWALLFNSESTIVVDHYSKSWNTASIQNMRPMSNTADIAQWLAL